MDATPSEIEREITDLRFETAEIVSELGRRVNSAKDVRSQIRQHPRFTTGLTLATVMSLGAVAYTVYRRATYRKPTVLRLEDQFEERIVEPLRSRARDFVVTEVPVKKEDTMVKRIVWAAFASAAAALASIMARRAVEAGWRRMMHEEPPH